MSRTGTGVGIDLGFDDVGAVGVGHRRRLEIDRAARPGGSPPGSAKPGTPASAWAISREAALHAGHALHAHRAADEFHILGRRLHAALAAVLLDLVGDELRRAIDRIAGGHRLAAGKGAEPERARLRCRRR